MLNREGGILDANGKIFPEVREARERGVLFDCGRSAVHFFYPVVDKVLQQDFFQTRLALTWYLDMPINHYEVHMTCPPICLPFSDWG